MTLTLVDWAIKLQTNQPLDICKQIKIEKKKKKKKRVRLNNYAGICYTLNKFMGDVAIVRFWVMLLHMYAFVEKTLKRT